MAKTREAAFSGIGDAVERYLKAKGYVRLGRENMVPAVWHEVVGDWYSQHTEVTRVENGVVTVACDSAPRAQQLQLDAPEIIRGLNARLGGRSIKELRPSSGAIRRLDKVTGNAPPLGPPGPTRYELDEIEISEPECAWTRSAASEIPDDALRLRFETVLVKSRRLARWQSEHGYAPCETCEALVRPGRKRCAACDPGRAPRQGSDEVIVWKTKAPWE